MHMFREVVGLTKILEAFMFLFLGLAHGYLVSSHESQIKHILGEVKLANYIYVFVIFLFPMICFVVFAIGSGRAPVAQRASRK
jgi:hydrogenase-4 membrane subunit HyfE